MQKNTENTVNNLTFNLFDLLQGVLKKNSSETELKAIIIIVVPFDDSILHKKQANFDSEPIVIPFDNLSKV